jgi:ABC-type sugar transport system ATPase subunit
VATAADVTAEPPVDAEALIIAERLGMRTGHGWVFRDVDLALTAGSVTALSGEGGTGRSMLLLALAGRARPTTGRLVVAGQERRGRIRAEVGVARVTSAVELDPDLRVVDHIREAELLAKGKTDYHWAASLLGVDMSPTAVVGDLPADEATLLAVALVLAGRPRAVVLDDVDQAVTPAQQHRIWTALCAVGAEGTAVVASVLDGAHAADAGADVITMQPPSEPPDRPGPPEPPERPDVPDTSTSSSEEGTADARG